MEDYEYKVIKLHATLFQNSSKFTGNISNNTGKSTSETDRIRLGGIHLAGVERRAPRACMSCRSWRRAGRRASTTLSRAIGNKSPAPTGLIFYRLLPIPTDSYRFFRTFLGELGETTLPTLPTVLFTS